MNDNFLNTLSEPFVILLISPPLGGKDTMVKKWLNLYNGNINIISRDAIILEEHGSNDYTTAFKTVNQKDVDILLTSKLEETNLNKTNAIIDMTNLSSKRRRYNLSFFDDKYTKIAVIFPILEFDEYLRRNELRNINENKFIPENVIHDMVKSYQKIKEDEGFDKIINL